MSEKYDTILTTFHVEFKGFPGYMPVNSTPVYIPDLPANVGKY